MCSRRPLHWCRTQLTQTGHGLHAQPVSDVHQVGQRSTTHTMQALSHAVGQLAQQGPSRCRDCCGQACWPPRRAARGDRRHSRSCPAHADAPEKQLSKPVVSVSTIVDMGQAVYHLTSMGSSQGRLVCRRPARRVHATACRSLLDWRASGAATHIACTASAAAAAHGGAWPQRGVSRGRTGGRQSRRGRCR